MIETERLILRPLTAEEIRLTIDNPDELDRMWNLKVRHCKEMELNPHLKEANECRLRMVLERPDQYLWYTLWNLILKSDSVIIGGIMVISEPNEQGEIELGYGTEQEYQNRGYMTEAVGMMVKWAFQNSNVKYVIAETEKDNFASHGVLTNNKFEKYKETEDGFWWRIKNAEIN